MLTNNSVRTGHSAGWFSFPKPNPRAGLRLFCFPYAGAASGIFSKWAGALPASVELALVQLPGRGARLREKPIDRMAELVEALERPFLPYLDKPMAFFGHSLGGLITFELSRRLRRQYGVEPAQLLISGCGPVRSSSRPTIYSLLPVELIGEARGTKNAEYARSTGEQLVQLVMPALKADLSLLENYRYEDDERLSCGITVFGGLDDPYVEYESLEVWRNQTSGPFALHLFRGDHLFIHTAETEILKVLSDELRELAAKVV